MSILASRNISEKVSWLSFTDTLASFVWDMKGKITSLIKDENQDIEMLLHMIYMGKTEESSPPRTKWSILIPQAERRSSAKDEWYVSLQDIIQAEPHNTPVMQKMYQSHETKFWSNDDDFSFFNYEGGYQGRRFRVIFYNSVKYDFDRLMQVKVPFDELLKKNEMVRICWY